MQIYLARDNKQAGPYTLDELNTMLADGQVQLTDLAWHQGMDSWKVLSELTGGLSYYNGIQTSPSTPPANATVNPSSAENTTETNTDNNLARRKSDNQQAETATKLQRFSATMLDFSLFMACFIPIAGHVKFPEKMPDGMTMAQQLEMVQNMMASIPASAITFTNFATLFFIVLQAVILVIRGQTIGKAAMGIRVVHTETDKILNATGILFKRFIPSLIIFYIFIVLSGPLAFVFYGVLIWLNKDGRLPQDKLANSIVRKATNKQLEK